MVMRTGTHVSFFKLHLFFVCVSIRGCACTHTHNIQRPKDYLEELVISFYHVGPGNQMQIIRPGGKYLYLLSRLARLKESLVAEWGPQARSVADAEGLAWGNASVTSACTGFCRRP